MAMMAYYTTANVPEEIKRYTREKVPLNNTLINGWVWSNWVLAMTPDLYDSDFRSRTTEEYERPGYKITKAALKRQFSDQKPCGIYEWMARHRRTGKQYVVYIGSTCRSKRGNFIDRIYEYCTSGAHKRDYIDSALENGYELFVRYKGSGCDTIACDRNWESAEDDENEVLKHFDYAWNIRSVKQIERNLPPH